MQKIIKQLSQELSISEKAIFNIYKAYWKFIKEKIINIDFDQIKSMDDYNKARVNFNIPNIGKLACSYERLNRIRQQNTYKQINNENKHKKDQTDV